MTTASRFGVQKGGRLMTRTSSAVRMMTEKPLARGKGVCGRQFSVSMTQTPVTSMAHPSAIFSSAAGTELKSTGTSKSSQFRFSR